MPVIAIRFVLALLLMVGASPAVQAAWFEVSSARFVVYADDSEKNLRRLSEQLELYHEAMERITGVELPNPSPSSRVVVYVVRNVTEVRKLYGAGVQGVAAFYIPRAGGSTAFVPRIQSERGQTDFSMTALMHEYAHHFIMSNNKSWLPQWLNEGSAEFFASAEFPEAGGITLGMPSTIRLVELANEKAVTMERLLDPAAFRDGARKGFDSFYGKSWALYHYLTLESQERRGQLGKYVRLIRDGKNWREAGVEAFGELRKLDVEIQAYMKRSGMLAVKFKPEDLQAGAISLRPLTPGEIAVMPVLLRSKRGVSLDDAKALLPEARKVAAKFPNDPAVLTALAEAEMDAREYANAITAANAALAVNPASVNALVQKGMALFQQASTAPAADREKAFATAMEPFLALNKIENDHPQPMIYFFRSFTQRGVRPSAEAASALDRAIQIAPFDTQLRVMRARYELNGRDYSGAREDLKYLAANPHVTAIAERANQVLDRLDAGGNPAPAELVRILDGSAPARTNAD